MRIHNLEIVAKSAVAWHYRCVRCEELQHARPHERPPPAECPEPETDAERLSTFRVPLATDPRQPYHVRGSDTSKAAADSIRPQLGKLQRAVYELFIEVGEHGCTDNEIEHRLELRHQSASARRRELELLGLVRKTDGRRRTDSGRWAAVYMLKARCVP